MQTGTVLLPRIREKQDAWENDGAMTHERPVAFQLRLTLPSTRRTDAPSTGRRADTRGGGGRGAKGRTHTPDEKPTMHRPEGAGNHVLTWRNHQKEPGGLCKLPTEDRGVRLENVRKALRKHRKSSKPLLNLSGTGLWSQHLLYLFYFCSLLYECGFTFIIVLPGSE